MKRKPLISLLLILMITTFSMSQVRPSGFFTQFSDVGSPGIKGSSRYDESSQEYTITASGTNMWFGEDSFSWIYEETEDDFILQTELRFVGEGVNPHRKAGLMIRSGLTNDAAHVSCVVHGDGLTALQFRSKKGIDTDELKFDISAPSVLQLEKRGNTFTMSVAPRGELYTGKSLELELEGPLYAGLFVCSHEDSVKEQTVFRNTRLFKPAPDDLVQYQDYLGSLLEVMEVETGHRWVVGESEVSWQAPNWKLDGKTLIYNSNGLLYEFDLPTGESRALSTGFANQNNNDHVISFDGSQMAISHHAEEDDGRSVIYTLPIEGGTPKRVTPLSPSYLHGWSTDDRYLVYTAGRQGIYDIYRISAEGGEEVQLTDLPTLDDGPEYSPDGKFIYFNSSRTGIMQLWRMDTDGSNPVQLTFDEYNDWFPHISPDGKWIAFISFPPEVPAGEHPFYKRVYLRLMSVEEMEPKVIGYLYGGQGSINVPSWSPDSKSIAFISNGIFK